MNSLLGDEAFSRIHQVRITDCARIDGRGTVVDRTLQSVNPSQFVKSQMPYRQMPYRQMPSRQEAHRVMPYLIDAFIS